MFKKFFNTELILKSDVAMANKERGLSALRLAYSDWRGENDICAIASVLGRLSNHRLQMIGLRREGLRDCVRDMMLSAEEDRVIVREIIAIIDASADSASGRREITHVKDIQS